MAKGIAGFLASMGIKPEQALELIDGFLDQLTQSAKAEQPLYGLVRVEYDDQGNIIDQSTLFVYESRDAAMVQLKDLVDREESSDVFFDIQEVDREDLEDEGDEEEDEDEDAPN